MAGVKISSFTFAFNAILGGYPVAEAVMAVKPFVDETVAVDMSSTDRTRELLESVCDKVIDCPWGEDPMKESFLRHVQCSGDIVLLHEADEIFDPRLAETCCDLARQGHTNLQVWRIQVSQNGQRIAVYPHPVHRVFPVGGHSPDPIPVVGPEHGYLWDLTRWFRDNYWDRRKACSKIWGPQRNVMVRDHFLQSPELSDAELRILLQEPHWEWKVSPFALPEIIKPLVGMVRYSPTVEGWNS